MGIFGGSILFSVIFSSFFFEFHSSLDYEWNNNLYGGWVGSAESIKVIVGFFDAFPFFIGLLIVALFQSWYRWIFAILFSFLIPAMFLFDSQLDIKDGGIIMIFAITGLGLGWLVGWAREGLVKK